MLSRKRDPLVYVLHMGLHLADKKHYLALFADERLKDAAPFHINRSKQPMGIESAPVLNKSKTGRNADVAR
jgi:hypothetical protein